MTRDYDERDFEPNVEKRDEERHDETPLAGAPREGEETRDDMRAPREGEETHDDARAHRERRPRIDSFEKMKVWQEAHALAMKVFQLTPTLPGEQQAGLAQQMEESAVAVPKNIAEGFKRRGPRNKAHFYNLAQSSLESLRYYFILCRDLRFGIAYDDLAADTEKVSRMLDGLIRSMMRA